MSTSFLSALFPLTSHCSYPSKFVDRADYEDSTGNLGRHRNTCEPPDSAEVQLIETFASGVTYSDERLRYFVALWCARRHRPYNIIDDPELQHIMVMLYQKVKIPSRHTVSRDIKSILDFSKARVITMFQVRFSSVFDRW